MRTAARSLTFPEMVRFRTERGVSAAIAEAARQHRTPIAEYLRRSLRAQLIADGVPLPELDAPADRRAA